MRETRTWTILPYYSRHMYARRVYWVELNWMIIFKIESNILETHQWWLFLFCWSSLVAGLARSMVNSTILCSRTLLLYSLSTPPRHTDTDWLPAILTEFGRLGSEEGHRNTGGMESNGDDAGDLPLPLPFLIYLSIFSFSLFSIDASGGTAKQRNIILNMLFFYKFLTFSSK